MASPEDTLDAGASPRFRHTLFIGVALASAGLGRVAYTWLLAHRAGAAAVSEFNLHFSLASLLCLPMAAGLQPALIKLVSEDRGRGPGGDAVWRWTRLASAWMSAALAIAGAALVAVHQGPDWAGNGLALLGLAVSLGFYYVLRGVLIGRGQVGMFAVMELGGNSVMLGLAWRGSEAVLPAIAYYAGFAAWGLWGTRVRSTIGNPQDAASRVTRFAIVAMAGTATSMAAALLAPLFLATHGSQEVAIFAAAFSTSLVLRFASDLVYLVLVPRFSFQFGKGDWAACRRELRRTGLACAALGATMVAAVLALAPRAMDTLYGSSYAVPGGTELTLLGSAVGCYVLSRPAIAFLSGTRWNHLPSINGAIILAAQVALLSALVPRWGGVGAAWATLGAAILDAVLAWAMALSRQRVAAPVALAGLA